ncbi:UdgX family uracil-DNA binding protein [Streptomyces antimicrobicus]|uniref:Type-4 uracil-DNA glycosylase n=1 Tax=Streptomyces antimicrobicus TaxID=2883108 RepID=A0ABS8B5A3_9ACTN|nr:UdgX family uracil-DNA binding protein [Streptomyces antimicrobicus]MCB5179782.1 UdgX family uracil-DNA binding protein [Streptomyces antimicrobicus]
MAGARPPERAPERAPEQAYDAGPFLPARGGLAAHRKAAAGCRGCPLYEGTTGTVFGAGDASARLMLVGEQPGDQEDRRGEPFVGPAGGLLRRALAEAGLDMDEAYVTNAVKHFKYVRPAGASAVSGSAAPAGGGKRRIHKQPNLRELSACRPWLTAELRLVDPELVVALGATAGKALWGSGFRVGERRGLLVPLPDLDGTPLHGQGLATIHPSAVLRAEDREALYQGLVEDLRTAARALT